MTGKERITRLLRGESIDRVALTTLIDGVGGATRKEFSEEYKNMPSMEFYKRLGYDIFCFGNYGLEKWAMYPYTIRCGAGEYSCTTANDGTVTEKRTIGKKNITGISKGHPIKYPVETTEDLKTLIEYYQAQEVIVFGGEELEQCRQSMRALKEDIGQYGIYTAAFPQSGVQTMLEYECGLENFYYLLADEPELVKQAIELIQDIRRKEHLALLEYMDADIVIPVENTSILLTSPDIYRRYTLDHIREYTEAAHKHGKLSVVHMCGNLKGLLNEFKAAGIDGIHALTPPPVGDCPFEDALDVLGDELVAIVGFDGAVIHDPKATRESIDELVKSTLTPRIKNARFIHAVGADGISTPVWKFEAVRDSVEKYGKI